MEYDYELADAGSTDLAATILGEAFSSDPLMEFVSNHAEYPRSVFAMLMPFYLKHGEVWMSRTQDTCIMCLKPGVTEKFKPSVFLLAQFFWEFGFGALRRILKLERALSTHHYAPAHYYLLAVGTTKQHAGSGTDILKFLMQRAREAGVPIYAENSNPAANRGFYQKLGFEVLGSVALEENGPAFEPILWRPDQQPSQPSGFVNR